MSIYHPSKDLLSKPEVRNQSRTFYPLILTAVGSHPLRRSLWGCDGHEKSKSMRTYGEARCGAFMEAKSGTTVSSMEKLGITLSRKWEVGNWKSLDRRKGRIIAKLFRASAPRRKRCSTSAASFLL